MLLTLNSLATRIQKRKVGFSARLLFIETTWIGSGASTVFVSQHVDCLSREGSEPKNKSRHATSHPREVKVKLHCKRKQFSWDTLSAMVLRSASTFNQCNYAKCVTYAPPPCSCVMYHVCIPPPLSLSLPKTLLHPVWALARWRGDRSRIAQLSFPKMDAQWPCMISPVALAIHSPMASWACDALCSRGTCPCQTVESLHSATSLSSSFDSDFSSSSSLQKISHLKFLVHSCRMSLGRSRRQSAMKMAKGRTDVPKNPLRVPIELLSGVRSQVKC